eukprot:a841293_130.p3 GENE.a841293_130~~a841293_130.p3  ORF type:complete len:128 (-),score=26.97 a841293_130:278-625(-)
MASRGATILANVVASVRASSSSHSAMGEVIERMAAPMCATPSAPKWHVLGEEYHFLMKSLVTYRRLIGENRATIDSTKEGDLRKIAHRVGLELPILYDESAEESAKSQGADSATK